MTQVKLWLLAAIGAGGALFTLSLVACSSAEPVSTPAPIAAVVAAPAQDPEPEIPPADGFDFPVGPPDAKRYYNAQPFGKNTHLGEDWNGNGGGNTDLGDPVYSVAIGWVRSAEDWGAGWGNVIEIWHNIGTTDQPKLISSFYAHLDTMLVEEGAMVKRGQQIGTIGNAHGAYWAHLHLEMRRDVHMELGGGYGTDTTGYLVPTRFIQQHRRMGSSE